LNQQKPENARVTLFPNYSRYSSDASLKATQVYQDIAQRHGLTITQLALSFVNQRPFVTSNIIGATSLEQLSENISSVDIVLSEEMLQEINEAHRAMPNPAP
jgi:aryl-alcohol dehydrogenase-like predicted oxidoreductase